MKISFWKSYYVFLISAGLNAINFGFNKHLYMFLSGLVEVPGYLSPLLFLLWVGRKLTSFMLYFTNALFLLLILVIPKSMKLDSALSVFRFFTKLALPVEFWQGEHGGKTSHSLSFISLSFPDTLAFVIYLSYFSLITNILLRKYTASWPGGK